MRDEMLENGNFDLQKCIDYFVNQLGVKYFMKIRQELDNDNPRVKIGYHDLDHMHNESNQIKKRTKQRKKKKRKLISMNIHFMQILLIRMIVIQILMDLVQNGPSLRPTVSTSGYLQDSQQ